MNITLLSLFAVALLSSCVSPRDTQRHAAEFILDKYCPNFCEGYLRTHSSFYRQTFERAMAGDHAALRRVFFDSDFHSGDNEAWHSAPGHILSALGDARFADFVSSLPARRQREAVVRVPTGLSGDDALFQRRFPLTHELYLALTMSNPISE